MSQLYEILAVLSPHESEEDVEAIIGGLRQQISTSGGEVLAVDNWGKRKLAYPIRKFEEGTYVLIHAEGPANLSADFRQHTRIRESILRELIIALDGAHEVAVRADLEEAGLLMAPHTSAGRMPTEAGLRLYVDGLLELGDLTDEERGSIESHCAGIGRSVEGLLAEASDALSGLSRSAGLVVAPSSELIRTQAPGAFVVLVEVRVLRRTTAYAELAADEVDTVATALELFPEEATVAGEAIARGGDRVSERHDADRVGVAGAAGDGDV